jgi:hypothetical protein
LELTRISNTPPAENIFLEKVDVEDQANHWCLGTNALTFGIRILCCQPTACQGGGVSTEK